MELPEDGLTIPATSKVHVSNYHGWRVDSQLLWREVGVSCFAAQETEQECKDRCLRLAEFLHYQVGINSGFNVYALEHPHMEQPDS